MKTGTKADKPSALTQILKIVGDAVRCESEREVGEQGAAETQLRTENAVSARARRGRRSRTSAETAGRMHNPCLAKAPFCLYGRHWGAHHDPINA
jgi:hypothetical protein